MARHVPEYRPAEASGPYRLVVVETLGTGHGLRLLRTACRVGLRTLFVTSGGDRYCDDLDVDLLEHPPPLLGVVAGVDTTDTGAVGRAITPFRDDNPAVISQVDRAQVPAALAAERLGLSSLLGVDVIRQCSDKARFREVLATAGLSRVRTRAATSRVTAVQAAESLGWPLVIKPASGSGSVGVRLARDRTELELALPKWDQGGGPVVLEEYLAGPLVSLEVFRWRNQSVILGLTDRVLSLPPEFAELSWTYPTSLGDGWRCSIEELGDRVLNELGFADGPAHMEFILTADGPRMVEVNPRIAGRGLTALVSSFSGYDEYELTLMRAVGVGRLPSRRPTVGFGSEHVVTGRPGSAVSAQVAVSAAGLPGVVHIRSVSANRSGESHGGLLDLGEAQATGDTFAEAQGRARAAAQYVMGLLVAS